MDTKLFKYMFTLLFITYNYQLQTYESSLYNNKCTNRSWEKNLSKAPKASDDDIQQAAKNLKSSSVEERSKAALIQRTEDAEQKLLEEKQARSIDQIVFGLVGIAIGTIGTIASISLAISFSRT